MDDNQYGQRVPTAEDVRAMFQILDFLDRGADKKDLDFMTDEISRRMGVYVLQFRDQPDDAAPHERG